MSTARRGPRAKVEKQQLWQRFSWGMRTSGSEAANCQWCTARRIEMSFSLDSLFVSCILYHNAGDLSRTIEEWTAGMRDMQAWRLTEDRPGIGRLQDSGDRPARGTRWNWQGMEDHGAVRDTGDFLVGAAISCAARGGFLDFAWFCRRRESGGPGRVRGGRREQAVAGRRIESGGLRLGREDY